MPWSVRSYYIKNQLMGLLFFTKVHLWADIWVFFCIFDREELEVSTQGEWASFTQDRTNKTKVGGGPYEWYIALLVFQKFCNRKSSSAACRINTPTCKVRELFIIILLFFPYP